jgi:hypothetical protein
MRRVVVSAVLCLASCLWVPGFACGQEDKDKAPAKEPVKEPVKKEIKKPEEIKPPKMAPVAPVAGPCEQIITCYKPQYTEREVKVVVNKLVPRQENYTCTVYKTVLNDVTRLETFYVTEQKPVEYTTTILVPYTVKEKRVIKDCSFVNETVPYKYTVLVPVTEPQTRTVCFTELTRKAVETTVPVCKIVPVPAVDCCGNSYQVCQRVVTYEKVVREVCVPVIKTKEVTVNVTRCVPVVKEGTKVICKPVYNDRVVEVEVTRCEAKPQIVKGTTCVLVPKTREVTCKVASSVPVQENRVRTVYDCKPEVVVRTVRVCEMVPYQIKVPVVVAPCCNPCW